MYTILGLIIYIAASGTPTLTSHWFKSNDQSEAIKACEDGMTTVVEQLNKQHLVIVDGGCYDAGQLVGIQTNGW